MDYRCVNVISDVRYVLKVLITAAVPMLNQMNLNHQLLHCILASCQNN